MIRPRVFTIPPSAPFLPTLIRSLIGGRLVPGFPAEGDPLALAAATLYLPTRRACRLARELFLDAIAAKSAILPRIVALGDIDEDEIAFAQAATGHLAGKALTLDPALDGLERRLLLARLIREWANRIAPPENGEASLVTGNPVSALALADDLARLMDDLTTREVPWERLDKLVPDDFDRYWQLTLEFLKIARESWPQILAERRAMDGAARRDMLIKAEAARLAANADAPVIAAGSTGSMPATAELLAVIAKLPHGAVVLPGLDTALDEESWQLIADRRDGGREVAAPAVSHPQFALQSLLQRIGIDRSDVVTLGEPAAHGREHLSSEAMRPAAVTDQWQKLAPQRFERAFDTLSIIEAANPEQESLAIGIALREAVEQDKTAALITPDRALARRVAAALARWDVTVDDSGGDPLADTSAGRFACLAAQVALGGLAPVGLLALLKHPLTRLGAPEGSLAGAVAALEMAVLRGTRPGRGSAGLTHALAVFRDQLGKLHRKEASDLHHSEPRTRLADAQLERATRLVAQLASALASIESLADKEHSFIEVARVHRAVLCALSGSETGEPAAFDGHDGAKLAEAFDEISSLGRDADLPVRPADYPELFELAIADRVVRRPQIAGAQVRIFGPLEARLQSVDRVILGGLVEGVWPPQVRSDPWLSRPMRSALGLDLPERRISLSAHDFAQALGAAEVILAYPARLGGAPTVISRFMQRLAAVAGEAQWERARENGAKYVSWARMLDAPKRIERIEKPTPKPPRAARPSSLSVTEIESWLRDPYTIYAKHVLKLRPLDPVDMPPGAADRGMVIHAALGEFTRTFAKALPADPAAALIEIGRKHFAALEDYPEARAFWWPRFVRIAQWFAGWETERRQQLALVAAEIDGRIEIPLDDRVFTLRARADRIEERADRQYAILDYKTGQVPTERQVRTGVSPQLTLEAAILRGGGFRGFPAAASIGELTYVALKGTNPPGENKTIDFSVGNPDVHAECALAKLKELIRRFDDEAQPYFPLVLSMWKNRYGTYDHLARVKEWSIGSEEEAGEE